MDFYLEAVAAAVTTTIEFGTYYSGILAAVEATP